jgi:cytochrome c-type biogenesis protein CcmH
VQGHENTGVNNEHASLKQGKIKKIPAVFPAAREFRRHDRPGQDKPYRKDFTMTLWLILTIMTSAAAVCLVAPLLRPAAAPGDEAAGDIAVYRDQLQEVERDLRDGRIDAAQAETARTEIRRRILAAGAPRPEGPSPGLSGRERSIVIVGATAIVAVGSAVLYAAIGNPGLAAASRAVELGRMDGLLRNSSLPPEHPPLDGLVQDGSGREGFPLKGLSAAGRAAESDGDPQAGLPTVEEMTRRLADRLARNPSDVEGWRTLGWSYLNIGRFDAAAAAYEKAIALDPGNMEFRGGRIEALVGAANGVVTAEARAAIAEVLKRDPRDARAQHYAELASAQQEGGNIGGNTAALRAADKGPTSQDVQAAEAMPPADRTAMIRGMVDGLARRLEGSPRDADAWIKLIRSRMVLGDGELARQALAHSLAVFADDAPERDRIAAAAHELGVSR